MAQNSQTELNGPRQWKRVNKLKIVNWNVCTFYNEQEKEMDKCKLEICALQALDGWGKDL